MYCSITGFGQDGPYARRPGYDALIQAMGGLMSITGDPDGEPQKIGVALSDVLAGLYAAAAILAAIVERDSSGEGQHIDLALLDVTVASLANQATSYLVAGCVPGRLGNAHPSIVPYQSFRTANGHCVVAVGNDGQFRRFARVLGKPGWADDGRFTTNSMRVDHRDELVPAIAEIMRTRPTAAWLEAFEAHAVPAGPINTIDAVFRDPQLLARGMKVELEHALGGLISLAGNPVKMSRTPVAYDRPPPMLDEHGDEILRELADAQTS